MIAKLEFEKVVLRGTPAYKIVGSAGIEPKKYLPTEYLALEPCFYLKSPILFQTGDGSNHFVGETFDRQGLDELIKYMKQAGERLTKINQNIADIEKTHCGEFTVTI